MHPHENGRIWGVVLVFGAPHSRSVPDQYYVSQIPACSCHLNILDVSTYTHSHTHTSVRPVLCSDEIAFILIVCDGVLNARPSFVTSSTAHSVRIPLLREHISSHTQLRVRDRTSRRIASVDTRRCSHTERKVCRAHQTDLKGYFYCVPDCREGIKSAAVVCCILNHA